MKLHESLEQERNEVEILKSKLANQIEDEEAAHLDAARAQVQKEWEFVQKKRNCLKKHGADRGKFG